MTSSMISSLNDNERMDPTHPRGDGPRRRRAFTAADKLAHLAAYEQACEHGEGGAYLRREGRVDECEALGFHVGRSGTAAALAEAPQ